MNKQLEQKYTMLKFQLENICKENGCILKEFFINSASTKFSLKYNTRSINFPIDQSNDEIINNFKKIIAKQNDFTCSICMDTEILAAFYCKYCLNHCCSICFNNLLDKLTKKIFTCPFCRKQSFT